MAAPRRALQTAAGFGLQLVIPRSSGIGTHPTSAECAQAARIALADGGPYKAGAERDEGARSKQNGYRFAAARQTVAYQCSWSCWRTAGTPGRHQSPSQELARGDVCSRSLDILTIQWATGDLPEECRFLLNTQLMFLKKEKDSASKQFDDDEWIRSLTEAQEVSHHRRPRRQRVMYEQHQRPTSKTSSARTDGESSRGNMGEIAMVFGDFDVSEKLQSCRLRCGAEDLAIFRVSSSTMNG